MPPTLFNLHGEYLMKEALAELRYFKIGERIINNARMEMIRLLSLNHKMS